MEITTNFAIGDRLWKIAGSKATCFEVKYIAYDGEVHYGEHPFDLCKEGQCFASKEELIRYIADDE